MIDRNFMIWIFGELLFSYTETQHLEDFKVYKFQHPNFRDEVEKSGPEVVSWLRWHSNQQKARTRSHALAFWPRAFSLLWCFEFQEANQWMQCCIYICKHFLLLISSVCQQGDTKERLLIFQSRVLSSIWVSHVLLLWNKQLVRQYRISVVTKVV